MRRSRTRQRYARHVSGSTAVLGSMTRYITPVGYRMLTYERDQLWKVERPKTTQEVGEATVLGDCSQGVECVYGTKKLRQIDLVPPDGFSCLVRRSLIYLWDDTSTAAKARQGTHRVSGLHHR
jgi:hypothetical protein